MLLAQSFTLCHCSLHFGLAWGQTSSQVFFIWCQSLQYYSSFSLEVKDKIGRPQHYIIHFHVDVLPQSSSSNGSLGGDLNSPMKNNVFFIQSLKFEKDKKRFTWKSVITISGKCKDKNLEKPLFPTPFAITEAKTSFGTPSNMRDAPGQSHVTGWDRSHGSLSSVLCMAARKIVRRSVLGPVRDIT